MTNLRRLEYFLAVARERNFTRAAERLHVAQPALSRQVRELEHELGTELIHRTTHDFELTEAGALLLARGPELLASADALWRSVRAHGSGEQGDVVVAYGASASYDTAPRLLEALARDQPGIAIETEVRAAAEIVAAVQDGSVDLGLVRCPPDAPGLERRTCAPTARACSCARTTGSPTRPAARLTDLSEEPLLLHPREANPGHYDAVVALCRDRTSSRTSSSGASSSTSARRRSCTATRSPSSASRRAPVCPPSSLAAAHTGPEPGDRARRTPSRSLARGGPAARRRGPHLGRARLGLTSCRSGLCAAATRVYVRPMDDSKTVARRYVAAVQAGDEAALRAIFAEDASWTLRRATCRSPASGGPRPHPRRLPRQGDGALRAGVGVRWR